MSCLSLVQCYSLFALFFVAKSAYDHFLLINGVPYLLQQDKTINKKELAIGINIDSTIELILQQSLIFILFKVVQLIFFNLGW